MKIITDTIDTTFQWKGYCLGYIGIGISPPPRHISWMFMRKLSNGNKGSINIETRIIFKGRNGSSPSFVVKRLARTETLDSFQVSLTNYSTKLCSSTINFPLRGEIKQIFTVPPLTRFHDIHPRYGSTVHESFKRTGNLHLNTSLYP